MKEKNIENKSAKNKVPPLKMPKTLPSLRNLFMRLSERLEKEHKQKVKGVSVCDHVKAAKKALIRGKSGAIEASILKELIKLLWSLIHSPLQQYDADSDSCRL